MQEWSPSCRHRARSMPRCCFEAVPAATFALSSAFIARSAERPPVGGRRLQTLGLHPLQAALVDGVRRVAARSPGRSMRQGARLACADMNSAHATLVAAPQFDVVPARVETAPHDWGGAEVHACHYHFVAEGQAHQRPGDLPLAGDAPNDGLDLSPQRLPRRSVAEGGGFCQALELHLHKIE